MAQRKIVIRNIQAGRLVGGKFVRSRRNPGLLESIRPGDRVTILNAHGQKRTGRAVMRGTYGWVLNMGGAHGTPGIADDRNTVAVSKSKSRNPSGVTFESRAHAAQALKLMRQVYNSVPRGAKVTKHGAHYEISVVGPEWDSRLQDARAMIRSSKPKRRSR